MNQNSKKKFFEIKKVNDTNRITNIWDENRDNILINYISKNLFTKKKWKKVSLLIRNKTPMQCLRRFRKINPNFNKGKWSKEEDTLILKYIETFGKNWNLISNSFKKRSSRQIRVRYENYLCPNIKKTKFDKKEDEIILSLHKKFKNNWSLYTNFLKGRPAKKIKFRYISLIRKATKEKFSKIKIFEIVKGK